MYYLSLNRAALIFIPPQEALNIAEATVIQVIIKSGKDLQHGPNNTDGPSIDMLAMYYDVQVEVTQAVRNLLVYDLALPLSFQGQKIDIDGRNYVLHGTRMPWSIADKLAGSLRWGIGSHSEVRMAKHKWVFELEMLNNVKDDSEEVEMEQVEGMLNVPGYRGLFG
ncbi:hypothetical protein E1B28_003092 [Marasmius oreades]|uniref:Uncharacterized protein n=1 Tax=Marasmius oreades TaxID=181124 RepID=A0A9P7UN27_9AGAR|nr:uncharacterized protein E1B28_003092 [Marasmius oreades]KAG7085534.1 hypothetical protein E1B28_003092 [Marasmius oreades]